MNIDPHHPAQTEFSHLKREFPILEFDPDRAPIIDPQREIKPIEIPERCVICFFQEVINKLMQQHRLTRLAEMKSEIGKHPIYKFEYKAQELALFHPGVGAPLAASLLEAAISRGCRKFIACGSCGVLDAGLPFGLPLLVKGAVRDEGTSYHYLPPAREVTAHPEAIRALETTLSRQQLAYRVVKTWTTDGYYRETPHKIALRKAEGCLAVDMEAAAFFAVARFRNVILGQLFYAGDDVSGERWKRRYWTRDKAMREQIFWIAVEACLEL
ncbi:MAG: nucleoside phosphorylase [candidate division KSB1 bacterium]|nr:nucleoside phosphorylase [candidate division KSB1 bacterium]MDZ7333813.1 nucleoside phosphorylase [candidate division KSB1 bacterium]MDZ7356056.1 nucleoside phosphorylase [candidate division KSB1 bacterium]